ncbi:MAG: amino acid permease [Syntrophales bacterium]
MIDTAKRSKGLSVFTAIAFAVGTMVGAGVFVLSGLVIKTAGPAAILSYLICGIVVSFSALSYAALASIFPENGGAGVHARPGARAGRTRRGRRDRGRNSARL